MVKYLRPKELGRLPARVARTIDEGAEALLRPVLDRVEAARSDLDRAPLDQLGDPFTPFLDAIRRTEPLEVLIGLGSLKTLLKHTMDRLRPLQSETRESTIQMLCEAIFLPTSGRKNRPVFPCVEAAEAIRDPFPAECAGVMATLMPRVDPRIRQGFVLCLSEGYEEDYRGKSQVRVPSFRFKGPAAARFTFPKSHPLDVFGFQFAMSFTGTAQDAQLMHWFNARLENWKSSRHR
jgi:hypothetical protein